MLIQSRNKRPAIEVFMQPFKLILAAILCLAIIGPAHARNTTPQGYMKSTAKSLGNNADVRTESGRKAWSKKTRSDAKNFANKEGRKYRKEPKWRNEQRSRNKKSSSSNSGVND